MFLPDLVVQLGKRKPKLLVLFKLLKLSLYKLSALQTDVSLIFVKISRPSSHNTRGAHDLAVLTFAYDSRRQRLRNILQSARFQNFTL